jgi:formate dehydrogenase beta subunit/formate dehydrogenase gamma subunit
MSGQHLEVRRSSASLWGEQTGIRTLSVVAKYIDTSTCIGCKACEVACQEWNDLKLVATEQAGTYQTLPSLDANFWNLIKFNEQELEGGGLAWLMRKDQCMHCADPGCLRACPAPGAIVQYENGIVDVNPDRCIGCGMCQMGCPFDVPRYQAKTSKMSKCTLCIDRVQVGLEPACIKACPTGCLQFGTKEDMVALGQKRVEQLKASGHEHASLYDPPGVGGASVVTVLAHGDHPEWYQLPADPHVPWSVKLWKGALRPVGLLAGAAAVVGAVAHYLTYGPKTVPADGTIAPTPTPTPTPLPTSEPAARKETAAEIARRTEDVVVGDEIVRHRLSTRVIHWTVALFFFVSLLTGLPIWTAYFKWMGALFGGLSVCRWLHPILGIGFVGGSLIMFVHWLRDMHFQENDYDWLGTDVLQYLRNEREDPEVGKFNGGQKLFFFAASLGALALLISGGVLWFPLYFHRLLQIASVYLHDMVVILFLLAVVFHIYLGTAAEPGTFRSMSRGTVDKRWAHHHHPRWYRDVTGDERKKPKE